MEIPIELVPLNCIRCGTAIPAEVNEVAWVCRQCEKGQQLGEDGLVPLKDNYAQQMKPTQKGRPFWVCEGHVTLDRDTYDSHGMNSKDAQRFWGQGHLFFIPAGSVLVSIIWFIERMVQS